MKMKFYHINHPPSYVREEEDLGLSGSSWITIEKELIAHVKRSLEMMPPHDRGHVLRHFIKTLVVLSRNI